MNPAATLPDVLTLGETAKYLRLSKKMKTG